MEKKPTKLKVILALTQDGQSQFRNLLKDYNKFFKNSQGAFLGKKHTYQPNDAAIDDPSKRELQLVVTTVDEKLDYFEETLANYLTNLFNQEATNASGTVKAELIVEDVSWGEYSSLELLRLKSFLENGELNEMYSSIPVRSDADSWEASTQEAHQGRSIYQKPLIEATVKTTVKESYILPDPNIANLKDASGYKPQVATKDTIIDLGKQTRQEFSGQYSHRERAEILRRISILRAAVTTALETANNATVLESQMTAKKLFNFLHRGKL